MNNEVILNVFHDSFTKLLYPHKLMKVSILKIYILTLLITMGISSCSKNEIDPEDYMTSMLSGDYSNGGLWKLYVTVNGESIQNYDKVRFESKNLTVGDFLFVNVIPGESKKEFKDVPLTVTEEGIAFTINHTKSKENIEVTGIVDLGTMTVNIKM